MERKVKITVRLSDKEYNHLKNQSENAGLKMEPFIRKLIMQVDLHPRPPDNISQLIREINPIGNNINQIARRVNNDDEVSQKQIEEIFRLLGEIYRLVKN